MTVPLAVTVTARTPGRYLQEAQRQAAAWGLPVLTRNAERPLYEWLGTDAEAVLALGGKGWTLHDVHGSLAWTPGMAAVRLKRLASGQGEEDIVVRLCELRPGDVVLDCTLGLAADALVCARAVGPTGRVIGVEGSFPLYALVSEGLRRSVLTRGLQLEARHGHALPVLQAMGARSVDCVLLDPMFDLPKQATTSFDMLRRYAVHQPLSPEVLAQAQRVARRWVVVKGARLGGEFARLGLEPLPISRFKAVVWARLPSR